MNELAYHWTRWYRIHFEGISSSDVPSSSDWFRNVCSHALIFSVICIKTEKYNLSSWSSWQKVLVSIFMHKKPIQYSDMHLLPAEIWNIYQYLCSQDSPLIHITLHSAKQVIFLTLITVRSWTVFTHKKPYIEILYIYSNIIYFSMILMILIFYLFIKVLTTALHDSSVGIHSPGTLWGPVSFNQRTWWISWQLTSFGIHDHPFS